MEQVANISNTIQNASKVNPFALSATISFAGPEVRIGSLAARKGAVAPAVATEEAPGAAHTSHKGRHAQVTRGETHAGYRFRLQLGEGKLALGGAHHEHEWAKPAPQFRKFCLTTKLDRSTCKKHALITQRSFAA